MHVIWGHALAQQLKGILVDSVGGDMRLANCVDEVLEHCGVCRSFDTAPHVSMFNGKLLVGLPYSDDLIALHAMDVYRQYSLLAPSRSKNPQEAWGASRGCTGRGFSTAQQCVGGSRIFVRTDLCSGRSASPKFQGAGELHWRPERRNGLARVFSYRLVPDDRLPGAQLLCGVQ